MNDILVKLFRYVLVGSVVVRVNLGMYVLRFIVIMEIYIWYLEKVKIWVFYGRFFLFLIIKNVLKIILLRYNLYIIIFFYVKYGIFK